MADISAQSERTVTTIEDILFGKAAILRALVIFNMLFALQTGLDAAYLWGGAALPDGLSYAAYAHRGAYPLIATALLAAGFVLAALRPGSTTSADPVIRRLVYAWVAQNIMLVISSILRLDLYIGIYALTYWRVAAFVWMGLVAAGLALIIARIALGKSNEWLLVRQSSDVIGDALCLLFHQLRSTDRQLQCRPFPRNDRPGHYPRRLVSALARPGRVSGARSFLRSSGKDGCRRRCPRTCKDCVGSDEDWYRIIQQNWRAWSFRDWRLNRYLDSERPARDFLRYRTLLAGPLIHAASHPRRRR